MSATLLAYRQGRHDPTISLGTHEVWRAVTTPEGMATLHISRLNTPEPRVDAFGDGAAWLAPRALDLSGIADVIPPITPHHRAVEVAQRRWGGLRLGRSHSSYTELIPAVLGQRVTGLEAQRQWAALVRRFGQRAPGPRDDLWTPPVPDVVASLPYTEFHTFGIERKRADTIIQVARHLAFLQRLDTSDSEPHQKTAQLQLIPGVGQWTAAVAGGLAFGDPDALLVGDFHVKNTVAYALTGRIRGTDEEMVKTLAPYAGQRHRVVRWLELSGTRAPARGPRQRIVSITRL